MTATLSLGLAGRSAPAPHPTAAFAGDIQAAAATDNGRPTSGGVGRSPPALPMQGGQMCKGHRLPRITGPSVIK